MAGDITDGEHLQATLRECPPRRIFHLAALTAHSERLADLPRFLHVNAGGVARLLDACDGLNDAPEGIVVMGSGEEYGPHDVAPLHEGLSLRPLTPYGISKAAATHACRSAWILGGVRVVVLRPFLLYGSGQSPRFFLGQLVQAILQRRKMEMTSGRQTRDFLHVDDAVEGMLLASGAASLHGEAANLCSGTEMPLKDLCRLLQEVAGVEEEIVVLGAIPHRRGEIFRYVGSNEKLRAATGWEPRIPIEEGLRRLLAGSQLP